MKRIKLTQGKYALVDDWNYDWLNLWKWCAEHSGRSWYAVRQSPRKHYKRHQIRMHREILGLEFGDGRQADHRNRNGLDNRERNIRICSSSTNLRNRASYGRTSKYKGVYWNKKARRWYAQITLSSGAKKYLGSFLKENEASRIYKEYKI